MVLYKCSEIKILPEKELILREVNLKMFNKILFSLDTYAKQTIHKTVLILKRLIISQKIHGTGK